MSAEGQTENINNYGGARSRVGRPIEITEEKLKRMAVCRIMNLNIERTAQFMGIAKPTFYEWLEKAKKIQELVDSGIWDIVTEKDKLYLKFSYVYNNASTELQAGCLTDIRTHGKKSWQAAAWLLERMDPEQWAKFEPQPVIKKRNEMEEPTVADEHKEFDPYEPETIARLILSYQEAQLIPEEISGGIIARSLSEDEADEVSSGNGKP